MQVHRMLLTFGFAALTVVGFVGLNPASVSATEKVTLCHFDVDDEDPYESIVIEVSENAVGKHMANHGDFVTALPVGTEDCHL